MIRAVVFAAIFAVIVASKITPALAQPEHWEGFVEAKVLAISDRAEDSLKADLDTLLRAQAAERVGQLVVKQEVYDKGEFRETINALNFASVTLRDRQYSYQKKDGVTYLHASAMASARAADLKRLFDFTAEHADIMLLAKRVLDASAKLAAYDGWGASEAVYERFDSVAGAVAPRSTIDYWRIKKELESADLVARMILALNRVADLNARQPVQVNDIGTTTVKGHPYVKVSISIGMSRDPDRRRQAWAYFVESGLPVDCSPGESLYVTGSRPNPKVIGCKLAVEPSAAELRKISAQVADSRVVVTGSTWWTQKDTCTLNENETFLLRETDRLLFPLDEKGPFQVRLEKTPVPGSDVCFPGEHGGMEIAGKQKASKIKH